MKCLVGILKRDRDDESWSSYIRTGEVEMTQKSKTSGQHA